MGIETIGIYSYAPPSLMYGFWKSCGVNTIQLASGAVGNDPAGREKDNAKLAEAAQSAQREGFKAYILLLSNFSGPDMFKDLFHPTKDPAGMEKRLGKLRETARACRGADGFLIFAGDPGGITDEMGTGTAEDYAYLAKKFIEVIREEAPDAKINLNPWAIAAFGTPNHSPFAAGFWLQETKMTKKLLAMEDLVNAEVGVELAFHDYYRTLALQCYDKELGEYPKWPMKPDIDALFGRGVKNIWGWPYFLLDEIDDGAGAGAGIQLETRYIFEIVKTYREMGMNGVIGNLGNATVTRQLNTYAMCRFAKDKDASPRGVIGEFAGFVASGDTAETLAEILCLIENDSNWHKKMPENRRLPPLRSAFGEASEALAALGTLKIRGEGEAYQGFEIQGTAKGYVDLVRERLEALDKR